jgi:hypothetical protein
MDMRPTAARLAAAIAFVSATMPIGASPQDATLAYKWTKGETLRYRLTQATDTTLSGFPGGTSDVTLHQVLNQAFTLTVEDVAADGAVSLNQVFESMRMEIDTPGGKVVIDSAAPSANAAPPEQIAHKIFASLIGATLKVTLTPSGRVQKTEGFDRVIDNMTKSMPADPAAAAAMRQLKASLGDAPMSAVFSQGFPEVPQRPVQPGDTWSVTAAVPNPLFGSINSSTEMTFGSSDGRTAKLLSKLKMERDPKVEAPATAMMGMKADMGTSTGDGEMAFDIQSGRLRTATINLLMPLSLAGTGPDGTPVNMRSTAKSTVKLELVAK